VKFEMKRIHHAALVCGLLVLPVACSGDDQQPAAEAQTSPQPSTESGQAQPAPAQAAPANDGTMRTGPAEAPRKEKEWQCPARRPDERND
jgi:hypothetical protein